MQPNTNAVLQDHPLVHGAVQVVLPMRTAHPESESSRTEAFKKLLPFACFLLLAPPCGGFYSMGHIFYLCCLTDKKNTGEERAANVVLNVFYLISWIPFFNLCYGIMKLHVSFDNRDVNFIDAVGPITTYYVFCLWILTVAFRLYRTGLSFEDTESHAHVRHLSDEEKALFATLRSSENEGLFTMPMLALNFVSAVVIVIALRVFNRLTNSEDSSTFENINFYTASVYWVGIFFIFLGSTIAVAVLYHRQMDAFRRLYHMTSHTIESKEFRDSIQLPYYNLLQQGTTKWNNVRIVLEKELAAPWSILNAIFLPTSLMFLIFLTGAFLYLAVAQVICLRGVGETVFIISVLLLCSIVYFGVIIGISASIEYYQGKNIETLAAVQWYLAKMLDLMTRKNSSGGHRIKQDTLVHYCQQGAEGDVIGSAFLANAELLTEHDLTTLMESLGATMRNLRDYPTRPKVLGLSAKGLKYFVLYILLITGNLFYFFITVRIRVSAHHV